MSGALRLLKLALFKSRLNSHSRNLLSIGMSRLIPKNLKKHLNRLKTSFFAMATLCLASACTSIWLPGMQANYLKSPVVLETAEQPAVPDYQIYQVTPKLITDLNKAREQKEREALEKLGPGMHNEEWNYRIGRTDALRVNVVGYPEFTLVAGLQNMSPMVMGVPSGSRVVYGDGYLDFPYAGRFKVEGLTREQLHDELVARLSKYIVKPQVDIEISGFRSRRMMAAGEFKNPGAYSATDQLMHISDFIGLAGGYTDNADLTQVLITRDKEAITLDLENLFYRGKISYDVMMHPSDVVTIPDKFSRKIFILGEVGTSPNLNQSRSYVMRRGLMSLTEVLSDAGGLNPFSSAANKVFLFRADKDNNKIAIYRLDASQPEALVMADEFKVQPRDVVFVSPTDFVEIGRIISQILPGIFGYNNAFAVPASNRPF